MALWLWQICLDFFATRRHPRGTCAVVRIARDCLWAMPARPGMVIQCERGVVWITQEGDGRDILLHAGQSYLSRRSGKLVATALEPATLRTSPAGFGLPRSQDILLHGSFTAQ
jgi:hypothetical protein